MFRCLISLSGSAILRSIEKSLVPPNLFLLFYPHRRRSFHTIARSLSSSSLYFYSLIEYHIHYPTMHFSSAFAASAIFALASGAVIGKRALSGEATFYGGNLAGGACSFSTYTPILPLRDCIIRLKLGRCRRVRCLHIRHGTKWKLHHCHGN